ncbi:MAG TPA: glycosyltransferase [Anaerolineales bacterium]|nr:glycosyltransferase [Anaerolineales bacterium]
MSLPQNQPSEINPLKTTTSPRGLISIILATYQESENIRDMLGAIFAALPDPVEIIVVDDNSPDQTWKIASDFGDARVKVVRRMNTRGLASAINRGIIESQGDFIGWMDSDMCHPPSMLPAMLESLNSCDVVIGSRYIQGGKDDRDPSRVLSSRLVNRLASLILGHGILDYDSGFILMHRNVLDSVSLSPSGYGAYFIEFIYACCRKGLKVVEIPYTFTERKKGVSKSNVNLIQFGLAGFGYITRILRARFAHLD